MKKNEFTLKNNIMKEIYFLQKQIVKLGDIVEHEGIKVSVTEELIELNPELFTIKYPTLYFKSITGVGDYTKDMIYKQENHKDYPTTIELTSNIGEKHVIYDWTSKYVKHGHNCFELTTKAEWDKQELLDEAKRRYPIGTVYKHFNSEYTINSPDMLTVSEMDHHFEGATAFETSIWVKSEAYNGVVYADGEWAEILPLKFTTEDGVDIYGDMRTYLVHPNNSVDICFRHALWDGNTERKSYKYFYHKENALAYIEKHKEKTLEDYENILVNYGGVIVYRNGATHDSVWDWFKNYEPKLYYTKILQLIADDLHEERYTHIHMNTSYHINNAYGINVHCGYDEGCVYFKSRELALKARDIMGDKVKYLFK